ncbi:MAG: 16S rRNA (adenine(1518)-N(6)/adenine(1519)-N(6))-dimethyltransferase RsmA [Rhizobiales bacterium]|nr:16S rRNA (adenine(1518)-N(6)/adenine(1519)-N(6))-dimethyltransferase RsmA [Hyphomicrobiales bacterium]
MSGQIDTLPPLREVVERHELMAKKALGQNFLFDLNLTSRIARQAGNLEGYDVIEIGPGPGGLTRAILANGASRVIAVERDPRCLPVLAEISEHYPNKLDVIEGDALKVDYKKMLQRPAKIIANLPYNVATPLLIGWVLNEEWPPYFESLTLMFQKEVAERICAKPRSKSYGRLSIICQWRCETNIAFEVGPQAFYPPPKVTSAIVTLIPREKPLECDVNKLERVTQAAFGQRRKMLRSSLKPLGGAALLKKAGIEETKRAEELNVEEFVALAREI